MNKIYLLVLVLVFPFFMTAQSLGNPLDPCPKSPNCFRSDLSSSKEKFQPFVFDDTMETVKAKLVSILENYPGATQESIQGNIIHYSFKTKVGKFVDDVHFYIVEENRVVHFRSANRVGWSEMGANKRRVKGLRKVWRLK